MALAAVAKFAVEFFCVWTCYFLLCALSYFCLTEKSHKQIRSSTQRSKYLKFVLSVVRCKRQFGFSIMWQWKRIGTVFIVELNKKLRRSVVSKVMLKPLQVKPPNNHLPIQMSTFTYFGQISFARSFVLYVHNSTQQEKTTQSPTRHVQPTTQHITNRREKTNDKRSGHRCYSIR